MQQNLVVHTWKNVQSFILEAVEDHFILKKNLTKLKVDKKDCEMSCVIQCHATPSKQIEMLRRLCFRHTYSSIHRNPHITICTIFRLDLKCNASYCDKKLGHCVHGDFNHCIEKPAEENNEKPKVKMHVKLSVWMDDTCQEE